MVHFYAIELPRSNYIQLRIPSGYYHMNFRLTESSNGLFI